MVHIVSKAQPASIELLPQAGAEQFPPLHHRLMLWLASHAGELEIKGSRFWRYATALGALGVATLLRWLFDPMLGDRAPYGMYLIAVLFVAWRAGLGPALATVLGGTLLGRYFFDPPRWTLWFVTESNETALLMSLSVGIGTVLVCESLRITARDNRRLYELARESDARKDEFLATLAHELRNPLTPIRNATYLLAMMKDQDPRAVELQQMIARHTEHMIRLVNDLLDLSRITQRKIELRREHVELQSIVDGAVEAVRPLLTEKRQDLQISVLADKLELDADGVRLTQVLTNLLHNAAKYTGNEGRIWLSVEVEDSSVVFRVRDTGIGIPPEMCERIFNLFEQVQQGIENSYGGLGIGLTLVRALVHLHGGTIEASSPGLGLGSEFVARLPISGSVNGHAAPPSAAEGTLSAPRERPLRVMVVDDSPAVAATLELVLLEWKHVVRVCPDGFAALAAVRAFKPDVVLADLGMPRMNGFQLAEELRRLPATREALLIAVSGYGQETDRQRSREAGFSRHLVKPVNLTELSQILTDYEMQASMAAPPSGG